MKTLRSTIIATALALTSNFAYSAVGEFFVHSSGFESYYGGPANGGPSSCYGSGNNRVYESARFLVYSAGSSDSAVITLANLHEEALTAMQQQLGISDSSLGISTSVSSKLKVCSDAKVADADGGGTGAASGVGTSLSALDHPSSKAKLTALNYKRGRELVRHELTHYVQQILIGDRNPYGSSGVERWFAEGLASFFENSDFDEAQTSTGIKTWLDSGKKNPIAVKTHADQSGYSSGDIYPYYRAAVEFIFHPQGAGNSTNRITQLFSLMKQGATFSNAMSASFSNNGSALSPSALQSNYRNWLIDFYGKLESSLLISNSPTSQVGALAGLNDTPTSEAMEYSAPGFITNGTLKLNASKLPDGKYKLYVADDPDDESFRGLKGPILVNVGAGKLLATSCDFAALNCSYTAPASVSAQSGWWWNANEPGRGYFIEVKNGRYFVASYLYDSGGNPIWYVTGPGSTGTNNLSGSLGGYRGGQTLTGSYKSPTGPTASGNFSITFQSPTQGTISWPGGSVPINRYEIASGSLSAPTPSFKPETGWWWNANEGGRGFSIEIQGDNIFVAGFMYDGAGNPIWYVSGGKMTNANYYEGTWQQCAGGMAMSGPFRPTACNNLSGGSIAINFSSTTNATLRLPDGRQLTLTRFSF